jgi:uracil-DNA glycosylase family 4
MSWQDKIRNPDCELCPLHESADYVCLMGQGPKKAKVMIVGEAPGEREDESHVAFVGPSGQLLRRTLLEAGLNPDDCYITNVNKCRPPDNRSPTKKEQKTCANEYLQAELERVDPDYVLAVGNAPLLTLCGLTGITKHRGSLVDLGDYKVFPTFHPAYILRSPQFGPTFRSDLQRFVGLVRGDAPKVTPTRTRIIRSREGLRWLRNELAKQRVVAFDFETNDRGPEVNKDDRYYSPWEEDAAIVCVSFSWQEGQSVVVPLWHDESPWRKSWARVLQYLKAPLEREDVKLVAHNGKFDCKWAWQFGVYTKLTFDTMLAAHVLEENRLKGLKPLSQLYLNADAYEIELVDTHMIPLKKLARYAGKDTDYTLRLYWILREELKQEPRLARVFARLMMRASNALTEVELGGTWVDPRRLRRQIRIVTRRKKLAQQEFLGYVKGKGYNDKMMNSPQQLAKFFFKELKLDPIKETKTGADSTDESVMLQLGKQHPAAAKLLEYRSYKGNLEKLVSWDNYRDERSRIHTQYKLFGTVTGRLSSVEPNLQQVPREGPMRACFGAPPGWKFVEADYSQIELRVAAMLANETTMIRILNSGEDLHTNTAMEITGESREKIETDDHLRVVWGKHPNFGLLYSMGPRGFVEYCLNHGVEISYAQAERAYKRFHRTYPRLRVWHDRQVRLAQRYGRVHSPIGRVRHLPTVLSSENYVRAEAERQAINSPAQSLASDLMLLSLVRLVQDLPKRRARVVGTVHDALLFEFRDDYVEEGVAMVRRVMEDLSEIEKFGAIITVPIVVEIKVGQHWGEGTVVR